MSKILFLTDYYYPNPTSIGVCDDAVIQQLLSDGIKVDVVCFGERTVFDPVQVIPGLRVFYVKDRLWERLNRHPYNWVRTFGRLICRLSQLSTMHWFPMQSITVPKRYLSSVRKIFGNDDYNQIVSSYAPFEATWAAYKICRQHSVKWSLYILDTFTNRGTSKFFSEKWNDKHGWRWEKKFYSQADQIINLKCHEQHHQQSRYNPYRNKMKFVDIPLYNPDKFNGIVKEINKEDMRFVYAGRIDSHWYPPQHMCELFLRISEGKNWRLYFFGNPSDCEKYLDSLDKSRIVKAGFISRSEVEQELINADVLVSFCHMDSEKIQSKIFDYMSTGNKILHITSKDNRDSAKDYYSNYSNAFIIDIDELHSEKRLDDLLRFLSDGKRLSLEERNNLFPLNRPQITAEILEELL